MILPGTTIDVSLKTDSVVIGDTTFRKSIRFGGVKLSDVVEELQRAAYLRGCKVPTSVLRFVLKRIGLPEVEVFPSTDEITKEDVLELSRALNMIDHMTDRFLSVSGDGEIDEDQLKALQTQAPPEAPKPSAEAVDYSQDITEPVPTSEEVEELMVNWHPENIPKGPVVRQSVSPDSEEVEELMFNWHPENIPKGPVAKRFVSPDSLPTVRAHFAWDDSISDEVPEEQATQAKDTTTDLKVVILGEQHVGVESILTETGYALVENDPSDDFRTRTPFIHTSVVEARGELIRTNVWSFDKAIDARLPRSEFFAGTGVAIVVYSVADRYTFDSLDFWIRELSTSFLVPPPIVLVGNKTDLRDHPVHEECDSDIDRAPPVTTEEGNRTCEALAKQLGCGGSAHPVILIETSCAIKGDQGIQGLFRRIAELWVDNGRISLPVTEPPSPSVR